MNENVALITGISMGLGHALAGELSARGWRVVGDAREAARLRRAVKSLPNPHSVVAIAGDVADPTRRRQLADAVADEGRLDLVVNNASILGPSPQPPLADFPITDLERVFAVNAIAPLALLQLVMPLLSHSGGRVITISSDAAVEAYTGWGGYGSAKAALDQLTAVLAVEHQRLRVYAFDPGDMDTHLHRQAEPGEDPSGLPSPAEVAGAHAARDRRRAERALPGASRRGGDRMRAAGEQGVVFELPPGSEAAKPPERRGVPRDGVRLLVARPDGMAHHRFRNLPDLLERGDLVVVNTSATVPSALIALRDDGRSTTVHVAGQLDDEDWVVELRRGDGLGPDLAARTGERLRLPAELTVRLVEPYPNPAADPSRLWRGRPSRPGTLTPYLAANGTRSDTATSGSRCPRGPPERVCDRARQR